jgi:hypothetical protein
MGNEIKVTISYSRLRALPGDQALIPILQEKGVPVVWNNTMGRIETTHGFLNWQDNGSGDRIFIYNGPIPQAAPPPPPPVPVARIETNIERAVRLED